MPQKQGKSKGIRPDSGLWWGLLPGLGVPANCMPGWVTVDHRKKQLKGRVLATVGLLLGYMALLIGVVGFFFVKA